ncbi:MAG: ABC transporter permease, partial [Alphaproteobacteria bacterium]
MIRLVPRTQFGFWPTVFPLLIALVLTIVVGFVVMLAMSEKPLSDIWTLLTFPWQARTASVQWGFVLQKTSYLAVIAVGLSIGFRANVWNIGAEGQFAFGSIAAFAGYLICGMPDTVWFLPVMLAFGVLGGVLWAL